MFGILARLLEFLYSLWPSYAGSIILFTVIIMLVLAPLTFKSTRSMLAMQALQPEMKKLQNQYKDDRQKLNEEMMKFYQENKISPLGGCLPMLLQMPVFFILYWVLLGLTKRGPFGADLGHSVACSIDTTANTCTSIGTYANAGFFHPSYLDHTSSLYQALSSTRVMESFGIDLSQSAWNIFSQGLIVALPYIAMVLIVMALTYLQQQQIQRRQPKNADQNPTQQMMMKVMPVAMGFIYIIIPAAVVVYFLVSSLFRIGQQAMVTRTFYSGPNGLAIATTATEVGPPGEREGSWKRFKDTLPKVGHDAKEERSRSFEGKSSQDDDRSPPARKPSSKSAKAGTKKPSQRQRPSGSTGGSGKSRPKAGSSGGSGGKGSGRKKSGTGSSPSSSRGGATGRATGNGSGPSKKAKSKGSPKQGAGKTSKSAGKSTGKSAGSEAKGSAKKSSGSTGVDRPSRAAPSRKAPPRPSDGKKNR